MLHRHNCLMLLLLLTLAGCAKSAATRPAVNNNLTNLPPPSASLANGGANTNAGNLNANNGPVLPIAATNASAITETEDAVLTSTTDYAGNRIETRVFKAHPRINKVIIITARNRTQRARVYGNRGEVRELLAALLKNALTLSGDELADATGLAMGKAAAQSPAIAPTRSATPAPIPPKANQNNNLPPVNP